MKIVPIIDGKKVCSRCGRNLPVSEYGHNPKAATGLRAACTHCEKLSLYKIDAAEYNALLATQNGCCAICGWRPLEGVYLSIDHDYATRKVRGLLCHHCNVALGAMRDDADLLERAAAYLRKHHATPKQVVRARAGRSHKYAQPILVERPRRGQAIIDSTIDSTLPST